VTHPDCDEWGTDDAGVVVELDSAWVALGGVGGKTQTEVETEREESGVVGGLARVKITPEGGVST
jgi:hypothetical protein